MLGRGHRITRECPNCGKLYEALAYVVERGRQLHCSPSCGAQRRRTSNALNLDAALWGKVARSDEASACWLWAGRTNRKGYGRLGVGSCEYLAHRLAWELTNGPIPCGLHVLHRCDNPPCCNPAHLFLGTNDDNVRDMVQKGRQARTSVPQPRGSLSPYSKLTAEEREYIRSSTERGVDLARRFGLSKSSITRIRNG